MPPGSCDPFAEQHGWCNRFYNEGFQSGHAHGKLHGVFEGRALGRQTGFERWEELGFYAGQARFWLDVLSAPSSRSGGAEGPKEKRYILSRASRGKRARF
jgi:hypothetical protein